MFNNIKVYLHYLIICYNNWEDISLSRFIDNEIQEMKEGLLLELNQLL